MASKRRTVKFYLLEEVDKDSRERSAALRIREVIAYIQGLDKLERTYDLNTSKFCLLEHIAATNRETHTLTFKSAKTAYRPNLLDRATIDERENPKRHTEGDGEKTHVIVKYAAGEVFFVVEQNGKGVNMNAIFRYLKKFTKKYYRERGERLPIFLEYSVMAKENFLDEVRRLRRVTFGEVFVEKSVLGGEALGFSNRTQNVRHDIILKVQAKKQESISVAVEDIFNKLAAGGSKINRIRVTGKSQENNDVVIDTAFIEKVEHVEADISPLTGEVNTVSINRKMREIADLLIG